MKSFTHEPREARALRDEENDSFQACEASQYAEYRLFGEGWAMTNRRLERHRRLANVAKLIRRHYADAALTLTVAADQCRTSKNHLNVLLMRETSYTFHALLTRFRLWRSVAMLGASDCSVLEVALANGFGSVSSFERNFKKLFGWPPSELRRVLLKPAAGRARSRPSQPFTSIPTPSALPISIPRHPL